MPLLLCKDCGNKISDAAEKCARCEAPVSISLSHTFDPDNAIRFRSPLTQATVADTACNGINAQRELLKRGLAWVYAKYSRDMNLFDLQADTGRARFGLWSDDNPRPPWAFRHGE